MEKFTELLFLVVIVAAVIYTLTMLIGSKSTAVVGLSVASLSIPNDSIQESIDRLSDESVDIVLGGKSDKNIKSSTYDEYDDKELLEDIDKNFIKNIDNVVIDGNNFIYRFFEYEGNGGYITTEQYFEYVEKSIKLLNKLLPKKNIFFILKDPENETQRKKAQEYLSCEVLDAGYKNYFNKLLKKYVKVRVIMAYGNSKSRDDFAAIWLSDQLGEKTILLSRDRYADVHNTNETTGNVKFVTYGKQVVKYNALLNKSFAFIDRASVRISLVGYTFSKKHKTAFYVKKINKRSNASDHVFVINAPTPVADGK
jgi:hypothetical protein